MSAKTVNGKGKKPASAATNLIGGLHIPKSVLR
jgi:hypothetical protein